MHYFSFRAAVAVLGATALTACGGGGGGSGERPTEPLDPPVEVDGAGYELLSNRAATGNVGMIYVIIDGQSPETNNSVTLNRSSGAVSGGDLNGENIDGVLFSNPAGGEYSRFVIDEGNSILGVVGLDVLANDLPTMGTSDYNVGVVEMTAIFEEGPYVLTGNATFTANWGANANLDGRFFNLSGNNAQGSSVVNQGIINLTNASINANGQFSGGSVTGAGLFAGLGGSSSTSGTQGAFFGPEAEELGGVLVINDNSEDIRILGAFQAD